MGGPCRRNPRVTCPSPRASRNGDRHGCQAHQGDSGRAEIGRRAGSDAPGPDRDCCCPPLTSAASRHPSSASKHLVRPWSGHAVLPPNPRSHHQRQGAPESRWAPRSPCRSLSPASLCRTLGAAGRHGAHPRLSRVRTGRGWPSARGSHCSPATCLRLPLAGDSWSLSPWFPITPA